VPKTTFVGLKQDCTICLDLENDAFMGLIRKKYIEITQGFEALLIFRSALLCSFAA